MIVTASAALLVSVTAFTYVFANRYRSEVIDHHRKYQYSMLQIVHNALEVSMINNQPEEIRIMLNALHLERKIRSLRIINLAGVIKYSTLKEEDGTDFDRDLLSNLQTSAIDSAFSEEIKPDEHTLTTVTKFRNSQRCYQCHGSKDTYLGFLAIETDLYDIDYAINRNRWEAIYIALASLLLTGGTIAVVHLRFVRKSFKKVLYAIKKVESGDFQTHINIRSKDELGQLSDSFNSMIDRLNHMREELRQAHLSQLERAERLASIGEIAAGIAHEIKNPIAGISSAIKVILDDMEPDDERHPIFQEIIRQARRVDDAINNLLTYSHPRKLEFGNVNINDLFESSLRLVREQAKRARVEIVIPNTNSYPFVRVDPEQIEQVMVNLLMNGIQAMPDGGMLRISVNAQAEMNELAINITDTGVGIEPDQLENIFKPFFTTKHRGTGLGLAIAKGIIERHRGWLCVSSTPGEGTIVSVILPTASSKLYTE